MGPWSGFITQIIYSTYQHGPAESFFIETENDEVILTEDGHPLEIEH